VSWFDDNGPQRGSGHGVDDPTPNPYPTPAPAPTPAPTPPGGPPPPPRQGPPSSGHGLTQAEIGNFLAHSGIANTGKWGGGWNQSWATGAPHALQSAIANGLSGQAAIDWIATNYGASVAKQIAWYPDKGVYGMQGSYAAPNAANGQLDLIQRQGTESGTGADKGTGIDPFGPNATKALGPLLTPWTQEFNHAGFVAPTDVTEQNDPGYQFRQQQGQQALERSASARGTLLTGGTLKDEQDYAQGLASQEYGNVWNRAFTDWGTGYNNALSAYNQARDTFFANQDRPFNKLSALAGSGQVAATNLGTQDTQFVNTGAGLLTGAGNANAAGIIGAANANSSFLSGIGNNALAASYLSSFGH
jgi:hypothetical protein